MSEISGKLLQTNRVAMNYYNVTDKDFENNQEVFIEDGKVLIYNKDGDLIEER